MPRAAGNRVELISLPLAPDVFATTIKRRKVYTKQAIVHALSSLTVEASTNPSTTTKSLGERDTAAETARLYRKSSERSLKGECMPLNLPASLEQSVRGRTARRVPNIDAWMEAASILAYLRPSGGTAPVGFNQTQQKCVLISRYAPLEGVNGVNGVNGAQGT